MSLFVYAANKKLYTNYKMISLILNKCYFIIVYYTAKSNIIFLLSF